MIDSKIFPKIENIHKQIIETETELLKKVPNFFINFLKIPQGKISNIINEYSRSILSPNIDYQDKNLIAKIQKYTKLADAIYNLYIFENNPIYNFVAPFEAKFLYAQNLIQNLRRLLYIGEVGDLQLEKILSGTERDFLGEVSTQPKDIPILQLFIPNTLFLDQYGNFNQNKTIKQELKTATIRSTLSSLKYSNIQKLLLFNLQNHSNYTSFGLFDSSIADIITEATAKELLHIYTRTVYYYAGSGLTISNAIEKTKSELYKIVNEYLTTGDSKQDKYNIGEIIFKINHKILLTLPEYTYQTQKQIGLEMLRLTLELIRDVDILPNNFYTLRFRQALQIEKVGPEVTYVMETHLLGKANIDDDFTTDLYAITLTNQSKEVLNYISSRGLNNSEQINRLIMPEQNIFKAFFSTS